MPPNGVRCGGLKSEGFEASLDAFLKNGVQTPEYVAFFASALE
jgi:hypothetical protein